MCENGARFLCVHYYSLIMSLHCTKTSPWKRWPFMYPSLIQSYEMGKNHVLWATNSRFLFHQLKIFTTRIKYLYDMYHLLFFLFLWKSMHLFRGRIQRKTWCMGPYAGELTITSPYVHSGVDCMQHIYHNNPMPESTLTLGQSRLYPQVRDFGFSLSSTVWKWVTKYWK